MNTGGIEMNQKICYTELKSNSNRNELNSTESAGFKRNESVTLYMIFS